MCSQSVCVCVYSDCIASNRKLVILFNKPTHGKWSIFCFLVQGLRRRSAHCAQFYVNLRAKCLSEKFRIKWCCTHKQRIKLNNDYWYFPRSCQWFSTRNIVCMCFCDLWTLFAEHVNFRRKEMAKHFHISFLFSQRDRNLQESVRRIDMKMQWGKMKNICCDE